MVEETADRVWFQLGAQLEGLLDDESDFIANCANTAALLYLELRDINWVGVYLLRGDFLVLGPFQGKPACTRIAMGEGVCGTAAARRSSVLVDDVHAFPGHIACDTASNSELVVPLLWRDELLGVLDIDSPILSRFEDRDRVGAEGIAAILLAASDIGRSGSR